MQSGPTESASAAGGRHSSSPAGGRTVAAGEQMESRDASVLLRLWQCHAACRLVLRLPELRLDERLLIVSSCSGTSVEMTR